jgi:hypothetical protein
MPSENQLLEAAAKAASYVGQKRYWTPYAGARPVECTAWTCSVTASFDAEGMKATVGSVWTKYCGPFGRVDQVWFPSEKWEGMPEAGAAGC